MSTPNRESQVAWPSSKPQVCDQGFLKSENFFRGSYKQKDSSRGDTASLAGNFHFGEHPDYTGNVSYVTDVSGTIVSKLTYKPHGEIYEQTGNDIFRYKYNGQEKDEGTGLLYYKARYYDPELQHFISADSIVPNITSTQAFNPYMYVRGNPIGKMDRDGHTDTETQCDDTVEEVNGDKCTKDDPAPVQQDQKQDQKQQQQGQQQDQQQDQQDQTKQDQNPPAPDPYKEAGHGSEGMYPSVGGNIPSNFPGINPQQQSTNTAVPATVPLTASINMDFGADYFSAAGKNFGNGLSADGVWNAIDGGCEFAYDSLIMNTGLGWIGKQAIAAMRASNKAVIGKLSDLKNLKWGENTLLKHLPDKGSPKLNWKQNSSVLRSEMNKGLPIRDASVDPLTRELINDTGFLRMERNLLRNKGWEYDSTTTLWYPPQ